MLLPTIWGSDTMEDLNGPVGETPSSTTPPDGGDVAALARLQFHIKENNIAYLVAIAVCYQMGILDKMFTYGSGVCG